MQVTRVIVATPRNDIAPAILSSHLHLALPARLANIMLSKIPFPFPAKNHARLAKHPSWDIPIRWHTFQISDKIPGKDTITARFVATQLLMRNYLIQDSTRCHAGHLP